MQQKAIQVGMSQLAVGRDSDQFTSVLGSCVGVALYDAQRKIGGYAHIVLADSRGQTATPGKFADTAILRLMAMLFKEGTHARALTAKIAGGAAMFNTSGAIQIGTDNIRAVRTLLGNSNIPLLGEHVGGTLGRKATIDCSTGVMTIDVFGEQSVHI